MNLDSFPEIDFCQGCGSRKAVTRVRCLGCMQIFKRCVECCPTFTSCSEACREKHRAKLNSFFGKDAPPITGEGGP